MLTWTVQVISPVFVIVGPVCLLESIFFLSEFLKSELFSDVW